MSASFQSTASSRAAVAASAAAGSLVEPAARLDALDAARAFALLLGIVFHASLSFLPTFMGWAVQDISTSPVVAWFVTLSHAFRLELFFLLAGFFGALTLERTGVAAFAGSRAVRLGLPFVAGWFVLRPLLVSGWIMGGASLRGDYAFWPSVQAGFAGLKSLPAELFTGTHLWFLYYLGLLTAAALLVRAGVRALGATGQRVQRGAVALAGGLANARGGLALLALPTAAAIWCMPNWSMETPDQSLRPSVPALVVYGGFFALGWCLHMRGEGLRGFGRLSADRWVGAALGIAATMGLAGFQLDPGHPQFAAAHAASVAGYALMMWSLVSLTLGLFQQCCAQPRVWVRYVADASYWLYLVHLPVVVWLQVAVAEAAGPWGLKLAFIVATTVAGGLLSYDLLVRGTWIGWVLNGRRKNSAFRAWLERDRCGLAAAVVPAGR